MHFNSIEGRRQQPAFDGHLVLRGRVYLNNQPKRLAGLEARGLPASLRFFRQAPSCRRARGCLLPPRLGTCGILPALLSVMVFISFPITECRILSSPTTLGHHAIVSATSGCADLV